jgi:hypothetical protein
MGVNLGTGNGPMPEDLLDVAQVSSAVQQMRRAGMPERVDAKSRVKTGDGQILLEHPAGAAIAQPCAVVVEK